MTALSKLAAAFFLVMWLISAPAKAAQFLITYTGSVVSGVDEIGIFGSPGMSIVGQRFRAEFLFNDPSPGARVTTSGNFSRTVSGGFAEIPSSIAPVSGFLTINGRSHFFDGNSQQGQVTVENQEPPLQIQDQIAVNIDGDSTDRIFRNRIFITIVDDTGSLTNSIFLNNLSYNLNQPSKFRFGLGNFSIGFDLPLSLSAFGTINPDFISIEILNSSVPEPANWTMMIFGFALIGISGRRRKLKYRWISAA